MLTVIAFGDRFSGMELRQLATFVAVAEEGSFTRAADRLHVVQSAVSAGVRNLEKELGTMLFDRSTHSVRLTRLRSRACCQRRARRWPLRRQPSDVVDRSQRRPARNGRARHHAGAGIGVPSTSPGLLAAFRAEHPGVAVEIRHSGGSSEMAREVAEGSMDLASSR